MKNFATISLLVFILITIVYFLLKAHFLNKKKAVKSLTYIYLAVTLLSQMAIVVSATKTMCGNAQWTTALIYGLLPWVVIFGGLFAILQIFPGWKSAFSNTFGYLVVYVMGIRDVFNGLIRSNVQTTKVELNKAIQEIYEDQSLLINQFTPSNWSKALIDLAPILKKNVLKKMPPKSLLAKMKTNEAPSNNVTSVDSIKNAPKQLGGAVKVASTTTDLLKLINMDNPFVKKLEYLVTIKDEMASLLWYILTGSLITSMSSMGVVSSQCNRTMKQIQDSRKKHQSALAEKAAENKKVKPMVYKVRD